MKPRLCLDRCLIQPWLINDGIVLDLHEKHHIETIDEIQNRLNEPANKMIVNGFLAKGSLDSILAYNENRKHSILKNFATTISQMFDDIEKPLTENWTHYNRIADTLISLIPDYNQNKFSQIQGDFSFLRRENIGALQELSIDQSYLIKKANSQIDYLVFQIEKMLKGIQPPIERVIPMEQPIQMIQQDIIGQWEEDGQQPMRVRESTLSQKEFRVNFQKDRGLYIVNQSEEKINDDHITRMVNLCVKFKPNQLDINLRFYLF